MKFPANRGNGNPSPALNTEARLLIENGPASARDVSIQGQILNIRQDLQEHLGPTVPFISHDFPVVRQMCDRVAAMKHGRLIKLQPADALFDVPQQVYSRDPLILIQRLESWCEGLLEKMCSSERHGRNP